MVVEKIKSGEKGMRSTILSTRLGIVSLIT
jgi:hypothetical protein